MNCSTSSPAPFLKALVPDSGLLFQQPVANVVNPDMSKLSDIRNQNMEIPVPLKYAMLLGYLRNHPVDTGRFGGLFGPDGLPDWNDVLSRPGSIDQLWPKPNSPQLELYSRWHVGYSEGQSATSGQPPRFRRSLGSRLGRL